LNASLEIPIFKQSLNSVLCQREEKRRVVKLGMVSSRKIPRPLAIFLTRGGKWDVMFFFWVLMWNSFAVFYARHYRPHLIYIFFSIFSLFNDSNEKVMVFDRMDEGSLTLLRTATPSPDSLR